MQHKLHFIFYRVDLCCYPIDWARRKNTQKIGRCPRGCETGVWVLTPLDNETSTSFPFDLCHCNFNPDISNSWFSEQIFIFLGDSKSRDSSVSGDFQWRLRVRVRFSNFKSPRSLCWSHGMRCAFDVIMRSLQTRILKSRSCTRYRTCLALVCSVHTKYGTSIHNIQSTYLSFWKRIR